MSPYHSTSTLYSLASFLYSHTFLYPSTSTLYSLVSSLYSHIFPCPSTYTLYSLVSFLICTRISWCQSTYTPLALKWMDQHQSVVLNGLTSDPQSISFGVTQGSLIGLLLFISIIDLPSVVKHRKILFYAESIQLYDRHRIHALRRSYANNRVWLNNNFLYYNYRKTKVMLTGTHQRLAGCLSFSGIPGPIFSSRTRIITRTRLLYSDTNLNRIRIAAVGSDISNRNRARIVVKSGPI